MRNIFIIILSIICFPFQCFGQEINKELYDKALSYIKESSRAKDFSEKAKYYSQSCAVFSTNDASSCNSSLEVSNIKVGEEEIQFGIESCVCSFIQQKLKIATSCNELALMQNKKANQILDSISESNKKLNLNCRSMPPNLLGYKEELKSGLYVLFSPICSNHLLAELRFVCIGSRMMGTSYTFYFVFDDLGEIENIYSGRKHYE